MKMRKLDTTKKVDDFLDKLPPKQCKQVFITVMDLRKNPTPYDSKMLQGSRDQYRVDIGEYRIIYKFNNDTVYIQIVGKRNDDEVYKSF